MSRQTSEIPQTQTQTQTRRALQDTIEDLKVDVQTFLDKGWFTSEEMEFIYSLEGVEGGRNGDGDGGGGRGARDGERGRGITGEAGRASGIRDEGGRGSGDRGEREWEWENWVRLMLGWLLALTL
ncbi:hypothetical protein SBOR_3314 [Sclerotinia borealis F-4128]|uniref:Uncharacterized protein n=1 Tax=Sclerotinia borealis (strain F-4128) TaxID=1432307 RepID=W9CNP0_SCLBF|nr:hypothetical protein SBOR_3314 [Sclerotinia borealis F-4128]